MLLRSGNLDFCLEIALGVVTFDLTKAERIVM